MSRTRHLDPPTALPAALDGQHGVFTADQAYAAGFTHAELQRLRGAGVLESVRRGVYAYRVALAEMDALGRYRVRTQAALLVLRRGTPARALRDTPVACASWPGARAASRAVRLADGRAANPGESFSRARLIAAGLAPTGLQVPVSDGDGLIGYADVGWLPLPVVGELDGRGTYGGEAAAAADAVWAEKRREDRIRAAGYAVVRWTWADLQDPGRWLERVRVALALAAAGRVVA